MGEYGAGIGNASVHNDNGICYSTWEMDPNHSSCRCSGVVRTPILLWHESALIPAQILLLEWLELGTMRTIKEQAIRFLKHCMAIQTKT